MLFESELSLYELQRDLANRLMAGEDIDSASIISLQAAIKACQMDSGAIYLVDDLAQVLYLQCATGFSPEFTRSVNRHDSATDRWKVASRGKPIYSNYEDLPIQQSPVLLAEGVSAIAFVPLMQKGNLIGGIVVASHQQYELRDQQKFVLETIAAQIGLNLIRIRAQEKLTSLDNKYQSILNASQDMIFSFTFDGKINFSNESFRTTLGYAQEEIVNHPVKDLIHLDDSVDYESFFKKITQSERYEDIISFRSKKGKLKDFYTRFSLGFWDFSHVVICQASLQKEPQKFVNLSSLEEGKYLIGLIPVPAIIVDPLEYTIRHGNKEFEMQFGYTDLDKQKINILQLFSENEYVRLIDGFKKRGLYSMKDSPHWSQIKKDGTPIYTSINMNPVRWMKSDSMLIIMNIEEEPENDFQNIQEDRYKEVVNKQVDLIVRFTKDGMITFVNQAYTDFFKKTPDQLIGRLVSEQIHEFDMELFKAHLSQISSQLPIRQSQNRMIDGLGRLRTVRWLDRGIFDGDKIIEIQGVGHDLTDEVSQTILKETMEQRYQILVEGLPGVVYVLHAETMFAIYISPQIEKLSGFKQQEVYDDPHFWISRIHPDDLSYVSSALERRIRGESDEIIEYRFIHRDGHIIWAQDRGSRFKSVEGTPLLQGVIMDISASQIAKQKLEFYAKFERMVNDFSLALMTVNAEQWDDLVNRILSEIGSQLDVDRAYLFQINHNENTSSNTHEWCAQDINPVIDMMQDVPLAGHEWWFDKLVAEGKIAFDDLDMIPEEGKETRELLEMQAIQSVLVVALQREDHFCGFIGFDMVHSSKHWDPEAILILRMISEMMLNAKMRIDPDHFIRIPKEN